MSSLGQKALLFKITLALLALDGCAQQVATDIEYTKRMFQHHYVSVGETLEGIAKFYGMTKEELILINQLRPPYRVTKGHRLHVHKREFFDRGSEITEDPPLPNSIERDRDNLDITDLEDYPGPKTNSIPRTTHVVVKRKGLGKLFLPIIAAGGALAALRPRMAFASNGSGSSPLTGSGLGGGNPGNSNPSSSTGGGRRLGTGNPHASNANLFDNNDGNTTAPIFTRFDLANERKSGAGGFFKSTALPLLGLATGGVGLGAALINATLGGMKKKTSVRAKSSLVLQNCCGTRPCFTWPINNQGRKFLIDAKNQRIKIFNTHNERYVRPANGGVIKKIIAPSSTGNLNMYTVVISHSTSTCRSTYETIYSGLVKIPNTLRVGREVNRDMVIGEIKPCCKDSKLFFQILDSGMPVKDTRRYLPGI